MMKILLSMILAAGIAMSQTALPKRTPPKIEGQTANGTAIQLPDAAAGKITLVILSFSRSASEQSNSWDRHVSEEFAHDKHFSSYTVAMLEDVPGMFRRIMKANIKNGTEPDKREHVVVSMTGSAPWRDFANVVDTNVPYLVLLDSTGQVRWSGHGVWEENQYQSLNVAVGTLEAEDKANQMTHQSAASQAR